MEKNQPKNEELVRFRTEAAALLGVNETKTDPLEARTRSKIASSVPVVPV